MSTVNLAITKQEKNSQEGGRRVQGRTLREPLVSWSTSSKQCTPILSLHMGGATNLPACCVILHKNMGVSDDDRQDHG